MFSFLSKWINTDYLTLIRNKTNNEKGEAYVGEATKIVIAVVLGAALLAGLVFINNETLLPRVEGRIREWFFVAQLRYTDRDTASELFSPMFDVYSEDDETATWGLFRLMQVSGLLDGSYHQTDEYAAAEAQMQADFMAAYPDGGTEEEAHDFAVDWYVDYAESQGIDLSATQYDYTKQNYAYELSYYKDASPEDYAEERAYFYEDMGVLLPETPYSTQEEWEAWLDTGEGIKLLEADFLGS